MKKSMLLCVVVFGQAVTLAAAEIVSHGAFASAPLQRYTPVPGGFAIHNGKAQFTRPLYGWHGDDDYRHPHKTIPFTGDRPRVRASAFKGMSVQMTNGMLAFGDGTEDVDFRYVWGRAEYDLAGKGTVKMVRSASPPVPTPSPSPFPNCCGMSAPACGASTASGSGSAA